MTRLATLEVGPQVAVEDPAAMSPDVVIRVQGVSKAYRMWETPSGRLHSMLYSTAASAVPRSADLHRRLKEKAQGQYRDFLALRNINFEVRRGEAVGIIGRNGSGKSTLLQIIAGTLHPSTGSVAVRGRVAALLELGSAFHPQFTGRENVYLYCSVLGIPRERVDELYDDIIAFADIGDFVGQPVMTYSSGMMLRLAFAVQTAIAPEILIVDEALAVGDMFFQAKCMRRIKRMLDEGTTLLFVSHAMSTVREVCEQGLLLDKGRVVFSGEASKATQEYLALQYGGSETASAASKPIAVGGARERDLQDGDGSNQASGQETRREPVTASVGSIVPSVYEGIEVYEKKASDGRVGSGKARVLNVQVLNASNEISDSFAFDERATLRLLVELKEPVRYLWIGYHIRTAQGTDIVHGDSNLGNMLEYDFQVGQKYIIEWSFNLRLQHGPYYVMCALSSVDRPYTMHTDWEHLDFVNHAYDFSVSPRSAGMLGGFVAWDDHLSITQLPSDQ